MIAILDNYSFLLPSRRNVGRPIALKTRHNNGSQATEEILFKICLWERDQCYLYRVATVEKNAIFDCRKTNFSFLTSVTDIVAVA